jgi:hypothetical protein
VCFAARMVATDRAFRALGRAEPETILALVETVAPRLLPETPRILPQDGLDTWLDRPPHPSEADSVLRLDPGDALLHVEGQGYREEEFCDRVMRYHLMLALRHWNRQVHTLALWLVPPPKEQNAGLLRHGAIEVKITMVVLRELDAAVLLQRPETVCFALGADDHGRGHDDLCREAVERMRLSGASLRRFQFAAVVARSHSSARFDAMLRAMSAQGVEAVIIEDLVKIGEEIGEEIGFRKGLRTGILALCEVLGLRVDDERRAELDAMGVPELEALTSRLKTSHSW